MYTLNKLEPVTFTRHLAPAARRTPEMDDFGAEPCIQQLFEAQAKRSPDAIAISIGNVGNVGNVGDNGKNTRLTYHELNARANQLAHYLRSLGVGPETLVGIYTERSPETMIGLLGILKAGGAYLPLDPAYPKERLAFMLADSQIPVLLTQAQLIEILPPHQARLVRLDADWDAIAQFSPDNPASQTDADNLAYVIYTSGSTGRPKGVMISHRSLANFVRAAVKIYGLGPEDRVLQFASISYDGAVEEIFPGLACGATLVLNTQLETSSAFLERCRQQQITVLDLTTAYWHRITAALLAQNLSLPPSVRLVIIGGEKALPHYVNKWRQIVGYQQVRLVNTYGPTEATVVATSDELSARFKAGELRETDVPIGSAWPNVETCILDQSLQPVPPGEAGELYIGGVDLARGYLNRPGLTAERFIVHPFSRKPGARLYKTGDLVRRQPDGSLQFLGRVDHLVKMRGFRIELGEIEAMLSQHQAVQQAVVIARDVEAGSGDKRLIAYLIPDKTRPAATADQFRQFLAQKLPHYMLPSHFILLDRFPLNPNGKLDHAALPLPQQIRPAVSTTYEPPRTPTENLLVSLWAETLSLEQVGIHDHFIELGGHSLLAIQLISRLRDAFQIELPVSSLFEAATVADMAQYIDAVQWAAQIPSPTPASHRHHKERRGERDEGEL